MDLFKIPELKNTELAQIDDQRKLYPCCLLNFSHTFSRKKKNTKERKERDEAKKPRPEDRMKEKRERKKEILEPKDLKQTMWALLGKCSSR